MTELSTMLGQLWSEASEKSKQPFLTKSEKAKQKYEKEMGAYKLTPEYSEFLQRKNTDKLIRKYAVQLGVNKNVFTRFPNDPNAPKRVPSAYFCYANDVRESVSES